MIADADLDTLPDAAADLESFLRLSRDLRARYRRPATWRYQGVEDFILTHGRRWTYTPKPAIIGWGARKSCYMNALNLAARHPGLVYVEGYALAHIPVPHAWCVATDGRLIDNTWRPDTVRAPRPFAYYGVALRTDYVLGMVRRQGYFGAFHPDLRDAWSLMTDEPAAYLRVVEVPNGHAGD